MLPAKKQPGAVTSRTLCKTTMCHFYTLVHIKQARYAHQLALEALGVRFCYLWTGQLFPSVSRLHAKLS